MRYSLLVPKLDHSERSTAKLQVDKIGSPVTYIVGIAFSVVKLDGFVLTESISYGLGPLDEGGCTSVLNSTSEPIEYTWYRISSRLWKMPLLLHAQSSDGFAISPSFES